MMERSGGRFMDCRVAENLVDNYIDGTLRGKELESFLKHIENCPSCYEELETYYIVHEATKQLDEEEDHLNFDMMGLLEEDIRERKIEIGRERWLNYFSFGISGVVIIAFAYFLAHVVFPWI
ncbi:MAG: zf-HC2 domain-containing protein [Clostridiales bacterium]|nr:zf-HC2 domain-containing protein [Candidatus Blautia equi]